MAETTERKGKKSIQPIFRSIGNCGPGMSPGSPIYIGDRIPTEATYSLIQYNREEISIITPDTIEEIFAMLEVDSVNWINVNGLADQDAIKRLCLFFRLDPLTIEDIMNTEHRPKMEEFDHYLILISKMITAHSDASIEYEQISFILAGNTLITFQETPGDCFGPVRERLQSGTGRLRKLDCSYLMYALVDVIVDNYFIILENLGSRLEELETQSMSAKEASTFMKNLQDVKTDLNHMRRILWPVRETVSMLVHTDSGLIGNELGPFFRDLYENMVQALEALESYRETASGLQEIYLSSISYRMNEVMKVLTVISTIFMPLTFIAGVYGMNFKYMPELSARWGYPATGGLMIVIAVGMIVYFKRKKWL